MNMAKPGTVSPCGNYFQRRLITSRNNTLNITLYTLCEVHSPRTGNGSWNGFAFDIRPIRRTSSDRSRIERTARTEPPHRPDGTDRAHIISVQVVPVGKVAVLVPLQLIPDSGTFCAPHQTACKPCWSLLSGLIALRNNYSTFKSAFSGQFLAGSGGCHE